MCFLRGALLFGFVHFLSLSQVLEKIKFFTGAATFRQHILCMHVILFE